MVDFHNMQDILISTVTGARIKLSDRHGFGQSRFSHQYTHLVLPRDNMTQVNIDSRYTRHAVESTRIPRGKKILFISLLGCTRKIRVTSLA